MIVTIFFPLFSGISAAIFAAAKAAPDEIPHGMPSRRASSRAVARETSLGIWMTSSIRPVSRMEGINPAPMPWILCGAG